MTSRASDRIGLPNEVLGDVERAMAASVAQWAVREVVGRRLELGEDHDHLLAPAMRGLCVDLGLQAAPWPEEIGGLGLVPPSGALARVAAIEQVARADVGLAFLLAASDAFVAAVSSDPSSVERLAPVFCDSDAPVIPALILPTLGAAGEGTPVTSDGRRPQATAREMSSGWQLDGQVMRPVNSGLDADLFGVVCGVEDDLVFFVVPADTAGVVIGDPIRPLGLAASRNALVTFDAVQLPPHARVAGGDAPCRSVRTWLLALSAAACAGGLLATVDILDDWAESRVIKGRGQPFKANSLTASLMGEVASHAQVSRLLTYEMGSALAHQQVEDGAIHTMACSVSRTVQSSAEAAIHVTLELMGSAGYAREWQLERIWRDVKAIGTSLGPDVLAQLQMARHTFGCTAR